MLVFQSFYGIPDNFHDARGRAVNAVLGFTLRMLDLLEQAIDTRHPGDKLVLCWDESLGSGFRHRLYPAYKANRPMADDAFIYQLQRCAEIGEALGLCQLASQEFEADDLLAALVHWQHQTGAPATIVSRDKDLAQIVMPGDLWWPFPGSAAWSHAQLLEHWQIPLPGIADYLALCGDAVDNIPGVRGIGAVSARALLQAHPSLEALYAHLDDLHKMPVRGASTLRHKLEAQREDVFLFRELTRLRHDSLDEAGWQSLQCVAADPGRFEQVLVACNLWPRVKKKAQQHFS